MRQAVVAEPDRQPVAVGRLAGLADGHDDAAPIGVLAGDRRLDQRRIGDRQRDALGRARRLRAGDGDFDLLARALAVAHHLQRQRLQHLVQRAAERRRAAHPWGR